MSKNPTEDRNEVRVALYLRTSADAENLGGLERQADNIMSAVARGDRPWAVAATYADRGVAGRLVRKQAALRRMLADIRGRVVVDAILVDTYERFGRHPRVARAARRARARRRVRLRRVDRGPGLGGHAPGGHGAAAILADEVRYAAAA